jgi:CheY-like chemotaxis protein
MACAQILIAEDNTDFLNLAEIVFTLEGFCVTTAINGKVALNALTDLRPAAILTDIMMPELDGISLIRHIRSNPELATIPIIVMSGARSGSLMDAQQAGATECLRKLVDPLELVRAVKSYLS